MRPHTLVFHGQFLPMLMALEASIQDQIGSILEALTVNAKFQPTCHPFDLEYAFQVSGEFFACQHVSGWEGWQLIWYFEPYDYEPMNVEFVVLKLRQAATRKPIKPQPYAW